MAQLNAKSALLMQTIFLCFLLQIDASHFRSATINYEIVDFSQREVRFSLVASFRRSFSWPKSDEQCSLYPGTCWSGSDGLPGVGDVVRLVGLRAETANGGPNAKNRWQGLYPTVQLSHGQASSRDLEDPQKSPGVLEANPTGNDGGWENYGDVRFCFGDEAETGEECEVVDLTVFAFSIAEDWLMGEAVFTHRYSRPYQSKGLYFSGAPFEFGQDPFAYRSWKATFSGCCRLDGAVLEQNGDHPFDIAAEVLLFEPTMANRSISVFLSGDLSKEGGFVAETFEYNPYASAIIRSLPTITLDMAESNGNGMDFELAAAIPSYYHDQLYLSHGFSFGDPFSSTQRVATTNYYSIHFPSLEYSLVGSTAGFYSKPAASIDVETGVVTFNEGEGVYSLVVGVRLGSAYSEVDILVRVLDSRRFVNAPPSLTVDEGKHLSCYVGFGCSVHLSASDRDTSDELVINYVFASSTLRSTHRHTSTSVLDRSSRVETRPLAANARFAKVFAGLPERYEIVTKNPLSGNCPFVTDMAVTYSSPPDVQNAVQDATYFGDNRQFSSLDSGVFLSEEEAIANGFEQVPGPDAGDVNGGTGGAIVNLWIKRECASTALTEVAVAYTREEAEALVQTAGYTGSFNITGASLLNDAFLYANLNEGNGNQRIALLLLRGSGPPITDVLLFDGTTSPAPGFVEVTAMGMPLISDTNLMVRNLNKGAVNVQARDIRLSIQKDRQNLVTRVFNIELLKHEDIGDYVACFAAVDLNSSTTAPRGGWAGGRYAASTQRCLHLSIQPNPLPSFTSPRSELTLPPLVLGDSVTLSVNVTHVNKRETTFLSLEGPGRLTLLSSGAAEYHWSPSEQWGGWNGQICFVALNEGGIDDQCYGEAVKMAGMGAGRPLCVESCLAAASSERDEALCFRRQQSTSVCLPLRTHRCVLQLKDGQDLSSVADRLGTNWLQLWHLNALMPHPESPLSPGDRVNIGHLYTVGFHDTLTGIASRFGTSAYKLKLLNRDLREMSDSDTIAQGSLLCILPDSCHAAPVA